MAGGAAALGCVALAATLADAPARNTRAQTPDLLQPRPACTSSSWQGDACAAQDVQADAFAVQW